MKLNKFPGDFRDDGNDKRNRSGFDAYQPVVETLKQEGFELVKTRNEGQKHGLIFVDEDLKHKNFFEIKEESRRYLGFVEKVKSDYSLCSYVYKNFNYFKIMDVVNGLFSINTTEEKTDQHQ